MFLLKEHVVFFSMNLLFEICSPVDIWLILKELKPTSEFAMTVFVGFVYGFPQYKAISDQVVMCVGCAFK
jgi:hypothetical protein